MKPTLKLETRHPKLETNGGARLPTSRITKPATTGGASVLASRIPQLETQNPKLETIERMRSALSARRRSLADLAELRKLLAEKSARHDVLEKTGDLQNAAVITEIASLHIFIAMLPRRIAAREEADAQAEQTLIAAVNQFIHQHLGPRVRHLAARTRALVKAELTPHYRDPSALNKAIAQSDKVRTIESLALPATFQPPRGAVEHAENVLKAWAAVDKFEKTLPL